LSGSSLPAPVIVSVGGNALLRRGQTGTIEEQFGNALEACVAVVAVSSNGAPLIVTHGNGPVVGNIAMRSEAASDIVAPMPLYIAGAESAGSIGFILQNTIRNLLGKAGSRRSVATLITQTVVDRDDPAFRNPSKPIGPFYSEKEASVIAKERGWTVKADGTRGFRRVVASPRPKRMVEAGVVKRLASEGVIVIACGGGGVPVVEDQNGNLTGVDAVVDKDLSTAFLGIEAGARLFVDLTSVDAVFLDYNRPEQRPIREMSVADAKRYLGEGHFAEGSMRPKIEAAIEFLEGGGKEVVITSPPLAMEALSGRAGTRIHP